MFLSLLQAGSFQAPVQVDTGLSGASSQPVIAAGDGGLMLVGFINAGGLYVTGRTSQGTAISAPSPLAGGALNPAISITDFGKAYLAFTVAAGSGYDVRTAYYYDGRWALESPPAELHSSRRCRHRHGPAPGRHRRRRRRDRRLGGGRPHPLATRVGDVPERGPRAGRRPALRMHRGVGGRTRGRYTGGLLIRAGGVPRGRDLRWAAAVPGTGRPTPRLGLRRDRGGRRAQRLLGRRRRGSADHDGRIRPWLDHVGPDRRPRHLRDLDGRSRGEHRGHAGQQP